MGADAPSAKERADAKRYAELSATLSRNKLKKMTCFAYLKGRCAKGDACTFLHAGEPNKKKMNFFCRIPKDAPPYEDAKAGALTFTVEIGKAFDRKVLKLNTLYDGKGGMFVGFEAPPDEYNFWLYMPEDLRGKKPNAEWLAAFTPWEGTATDEDWAGPLVDLFSPDYMTAERKPWDTPALYPNSRRFIDLRDGSAIRCTWWVTASLTALLTLHSSDSVDTTRSCTLAEPVCIIAFSI